MISTSDREKADQLLQKLASKNDAIHTHSLRMAEWVENINDCQHLYDGDGDILYLAAQLHDIGLLKISDHILSKSARLTLDEYEQMKHHPIDGAEMVSDFACAEILMPIIRGHHENINGHGYPDGLSGNDIPIGARILHIAEAYDAMTVDRGFGRGGRPVTNVIAELMEYADRMYDPLILTAMKPFWDDIV